MVFVPQTAYSNVENKRALGGTYVAYTLDTSGEGRAANQSKGGLAVNLYLLDKYHWSPTDNRGTQCVHEAAWRLTEKGAAKDFVQFGEAQVSVGVDSLKENDVFKPSSSEPVSRSPANVQSNLDRLEEPMSVDPMQPMDSSQEVEGLSPVQAGTPPKGE